MIDREYIVSGLESILRSLKAKKTCEMNGIMLSVDDAEGIVALLKEYAEMEKTYSQVLMGTTGNLFSKTNYTLTAIMDCIREHYCDGCDIREELDALLKAQEPRVMTAEEVADCEEGTVLWVEERQGVTWNLFPLEIDVSSTHPDTGTNYLFFITYHDIRKFECDEYNRTWRCWTQRPSEEQRRAAKWE